MSLSFLRDSVSKALQERVDRAVTRAVNMRVHSGTRSDTYALEQADALSEARAFGEAINIVIAEYKRLTESPTQPEESNESPPQKEPMY